MPKQKYKDAKGRTRWIRNDEVGGIVKQLGDYLIIGDSLPGVGGVITGYLDEIIRTGTTEKFDDDQYGTPPPRSVLELTEIERLGAKTAKMLYQEHGIDSLKSLCKYAKAGKLVGIKGIGPKMLSTIDALCK